ncbi:hypothetical protein [Devosia salina]|uniref:EF-hand domain-containing protein n=1 Tax=Devosia salina TaxID=2860336 RepID=A0ABX8WD78_9HYPH|nr:hypothetical protein [Devosia salina]QYO76723.1 hypothetical protein K1X15_19455 [Devosia salina]
MNKLTLSLIALTLAATPALAQTPLTFADVDADASGELSFEELQAVWPDITHDEFMAADLDMNGGLNADELAGLQPSALPAPDATPTPMPMDNGAMQPDAPAGPTTSLTDSAD